MKENEPIRLRKTLSLFNSVGIIMGYIIGSGIFISASTVARKCGSTGLSLIIWVITGMIATTGGMSYAELGSAITKSGGEYAYLQSAYGNIFAFLYSWNLLIVVMPASTSVKALAFGKYTLRSIYKECDPPLYLTLLISDMSIILLAVINCFSVRLSSIIQNIFTAAKAISLIIIIGAGLHALAMDHSLIYRINFDNTSNDVGAISLAIYAGIFTYSGWNCLNSISEEVINPKRNIPLAIILSLGSVIVIYMLVNFAYFVVIPKHILVTTHTIGLSFADQIAYYLYQSLPIFVTLSTFGSMNGGFLSLSRAFFAAGRDGNLPRVFSLVSIKLRTPVIPLLITAIISFIIVSVNDVEAIINFLTFGESIFQALTISTLLYMRWSQSDYNPKFKVSLFYPLFFIVVEIFLHITTLMAKPKACGYSLLIILCGIPVYYIFVKGVAHNHKYKKLSRSFSKFLQKLLVSDFATEEILY